MKDSFLYLVRISSAGGELDTFEPLEQRVVLDQLVRLCSFPLDYTGLSGRECRLRQLFVCYRFCLVLLLYTDRTGFTSDEGFRIQTESYFFLTEYRSLDSYTIFV